VIERSANGRDFTVLTKVPAAGNSAAPRTYSVVDDKPLAGVSFYRLRMVDKDGKNTVSRIIKVVFDRAVVVTFAPNPAKTTLVINVIEAKEPVNVQLMDAQGKAVRQRLSPAGNNQPVVFNVAGLSKGLYVLKMTTSQSVQAEKVVIE
jgi:trimeric autotransporter adhesin